MGYYPFIVLSLSKKNIPSNLKIKTNKKDTMNEVSVCKKGF